MLGSDFRAGSRHRANGRVAERKDGREGRKQEADDSRGCEWCWEMR